MADNIPSVGTYRLLVDRAHEPVSQGTAFCVRSNVVATAFHVIGDEIHGRWHDEDDATVTYRIELSGGISIELEPLLGYPGADLALLRCKDPTRHLSSNDVAVLVGRSPRFFQQWRAGAFPAFASGKQFDLFGRIVSVRPDDGAKALQLHIESGTIADWRGVSGAPIVVAEGVIGLLTNVTENVSAGWAALSSTFCALLTLHDSGVVHELEDWVGAQLQAFPWSHVRLAVWDPAFGRLRA